jgi:hypothetical protein
MTLAKQISYFVTKNPATRKSWALKNSAIPKRIHCVAVEKQKSKCPVLS